jgi:DNA-binding NarL/FixJ family response regulator
LSRSDSTSHRNTGHAALRRDPIRLALIEPQILVREALIALLERAGGIAVVVAASDCGEILPTLQQSAIDLVLLTVESQLEDPEGTLERIVGGPAQRRRVLVLTSHTDPAFQVRMVELGAMGVVLKDQTGEVLRRAVTRVHDGEMWLDRSRLTLVMNDLTRAQRDLPDIDIVKVQSLSTREREVVALVADGLSNGRIAERLFISSVTVRNHLTSILSKLDLPDRFQLAVYVFRRGLVLCPPTPAMRRMSETMNGGPVRPGKRRGVRQSHG